jgi:hypothetical protein
MKSAKVKPKRGKSDGMRYGRGLPRSVPEGRVLAHNIVAHGAFWPSGVNSFRWWTWPRENKPRDFLRCHCGWMGLPHFAAREHAKHFKCKGFKSREWTKADIAAVLEEELGVPPVASSTT